MRGALPDDVRLKWTFPVRSVDTLMICVAAGVDLFNRDPRSILTDAVRRSELGPLIVPLRGVDYS